MITKGTSILRNLHMLVDGFDLYSRHLCIETCLQRSNCDSCFFGYDLMPVATLVMGAIQFLAILELKPGATVPGCADDGASDSALFGEEYFP